MNTTPFAITLTEENEPFALSRWGLTIADMRRHSRDVFNPLPIRLLATGHGLVVVEQVDKWIAQLPTLIPIDDVETAHENRQRLAAAMPNPGALELAELRLQEEYWIERAKRGNNHGRATEYPLD
jgi:hypothetical protein